MSEALRKNAKEKIMNAAWKLFQEKGYEETTIAEIIEQSGTSRSAFYHHFHGKEELLFSVAYTYDDNYELWLKQDYDETVPTVDNLLSFNTCVLNAVEDSPFRAFYPALYGLQVMSDGVRHLLNPDRAYYQIIRGLLKQGMERGDIVSSYSYATLTDMITSAQIGIIYDWCLQQKRFSLVEYGEHLLRPFLESLRAQPVSESSPTS